MTQRSNRRDFIKTTALGATSGLILSSAKPAWSNAANEKLNIALIGAGNQGRGFIRRINRIGQTLVAVCDVDQERIKAAREEMEEERRLPADTPVFADFHQMLDQMGAKIDAVVIATPHHTQPAINAACMRAGKHVYCEKPIAHDVGEARAIRDLVNKQKVVTQMGNQGVATDSFRRILEQVQDGRIGEIRETHQWYVQQPGAGIRVLREPPADPTKMPEGFNWDLWLGPAAMRPYDYKFMRWANWRDFGTGMLGMGGSHSCHMTFNSLNLRSLWEGNGGQPRTIRVEAECSEVGADQFPQWEMVRFDVPARGSMPPARLNWYKGKQEDLERLGVLAKLEKIAGRSLDWGSGWAQTSGSLVVGAKGVAHTNMHNSECALLPLDQFSDQGGPPQRIARSGSHEREWANSIRTGGPLPFSNFDYAGPVIELLLLGNICTLLGRPIEYDPVTGKIVNDSEADRALRPVRRAGWEI